MTPRKFQTKEELLAWVKKMKSQPKKVRDVVHKIAKIQVERFKEIESRRREGADRLPVCILCDNPNKSCDIHVTNLFFAGSVHESCCRQWEEENRDRIVEKYNLEKH